METSNPIEEITARIVRNFRPEKIILFGPRAHGNPGPDSDYDLLVILPFEGRPFMKSVEILQTVHADVSLDLVARTPEDVARRYREFDPLMRHALDHGRILYERHGS